MSAEPLRDAVTRVAEAAEADPEEARMVVGRLLEALEAGTVRAAEPGPDGWIVHAWVKRGLLLAFRHGRNVAWDLPPFHFADRDTLPTQNPMRQGSGVRVVPGGSSVRRGAHVGSGVVVMPPSFVNVGAFVGPQTMIDSHVLVGSCAQIGARVHLSAAAQIGGVLEPVGAMPVVVEDDAFIGGACGLFEGARVGRSAVLAPGVLLTRSVPLYDAVRGITIRAGDSGVLAIPERAVVVPGTRPLTGTWPASQGLSAYAPIIVKYRDARTDAAAALEEALR